MSLLCFTVNFFRIPPLFTGCIFDVFRYQSRITFESKPYQRRSGASLNRESPGGEVLFPRLFPPPVPFPVRHSFMQAIGYQLWWGNFEKKFVKIWKRDKVCLIFAPAKTERGRRDEGTASSRGGGVLAMLTTIFPGWDPLNGESRKKVWKNFGKDLEGMIKTPYLCTRFRSWKSDGDEDDKKSSLTILTWK